MRYIPDWKEFTEKYSPGTNFPFVHTGYRINGHSSKLEPLNEDHQLNRYYGYLRKKAYVAWRGGTPHEVEFQEKNRPDD